MPEEFNYDPVTRTYGEPQRRPEVRSATIEFIAPSEYMASILAFIHRNMHEKNIGFKMPHLRQMWVDVKRHYLVIDKASGYPMVKICYTQIGI